MPRQPFDPTTDVIDASHRFKRHNDTFHADVLDAVKAEDGMTYLGAADVFAVQSGSDALGVHYVAVYRDVDQVSCDCKGFRMRNVCGHIKKVAGRVDMDPTV